MTALQYVETILNDNWTPSITGRNVDVPKPQIIRESSDKYRRMEPARYDYIVVTDGGISDISPKAVGWTEEDQTSRVTLDIRTSEGRERLNGHRDANNDSERYGGLVGETLRIVHTVRRGDKDWDLIIPYEADDLSGQMGGNVWRAAVEVRLEARNIVIDPSI